MKAEDEAEFREFYLANWGRMLRTAVLLTDDHGRAEDLVQNTMLRVHRHWHRVTRTELPEAYTRRILFNQFCSAWRRRRPESLQDSIPDTETTSGFAEVELRQELWPAVSALPPRMRAVIVLRYFEDLSEKDTADVLGCSVGAVKSHASRGLRRLRAVMPRDHLDDDSRDRSSSSDLLAKAPRAVMRSLS